MVAKSFEVGDLVWAKMKHYSPWPGKIMDPPAEAKSPKAKKHHHYVFFFGTDNHAWIPDEGIFLHNDRLVEKFGSKKKTALFQTAVETIVENSKGISKYHKQKDNFKTHTNEDTPPKEKESENSFAKTDTSPKTKTQQSNSVQRKVLKKKSVKKLTPLQKPPRKRSYSSDSNPEIYEYPKEDFDFVETRYANLLANIPPNIGYNTEMSPSTPVTGLLSRVYTERPQTPPIDLSYESEALKEKEIQPSAMKIGFLGLGKLGQGIVKNLLQSGHSVTVWNRTTEKCMPFKEEFENINIATTPSDVVIASDITFCCVSDTEAAKTLVFGNCGILKGLESCSGERKGCVQMTSMEPLISKATGEEIKMRGGRYLEASISGSRIEANDGTLFIFAAGDETLYEDCKSCLDAASRKHIFISADVGTASTLSLIHNTLCGTVFAALAESLSLVSHTKLKGEDFLLVLKDGMLNRDTIMNKGMCMIKSDYVSNTPLKHVQKDLNMGLLLGSDVEQPTPILAMANEVYKHCKLLRYGDHDVSAVYEGTKP